MLSLEDARFMTSTIYIGFILPQTCMVLVCCEYYEICYQITTLMVPKYPKHIMHLQILRNNH